MTRKMKATELMRLINDGPSLMIVKDADAHIMKERIERDVKLWLKTWVKPLAVDLIKELTPRCVRCGYVAPNHSKHCNRW